MLVLGIETSCDETGIGLVDSEAGVIGQALFSQIKLHRPHGGVVPELAARDHLSKLLPLIEQAVGGHNKLAAIDAIAYTKGPGLVGALMTGAVFAHGLGAALAKPLIGIHHMEAHLLVCDLAAGSFDPPYLALLVSGGHTQLLEVRGVGNYRLLGETQDDAVGEAFDKVARMLNLSYPGGPAIEALAQQGVAGRFEFPRPMSEHDNFDFSFSGLKTKVLRTLELHAGERNMQLDADIALEFQTAAVDALFIKCRKAVDETGIERLVLAGGVAANQYLRSRIADLEQQSVDIFYPPLDLCTDNGVMIAYAGLRRLQEGAGFDMFPDVYARFPITDLAPPG